MTMLIPYYLAIDNVNNIISFRCNKLDKFDANCIYKHFEDEQCKARCNCRVTMKLKDYNQMKENPIKWASMNLQSETFGYPLIAQDLIDGLIEFL